jgi:hypothetical protein
MIISKKTLDKIREIINKHYNRLVISSIGKQHLKKEDLEELKNQGFDVENETSLLELVYNHNFINKATDSSGPSSVEDMKSQQRVPGIKPIGEAHDYTVDTLNDSMKQYIEKQKQEINTRIESIIRKFNDSYKLDALQNLNRDSFADRLVKESTLYKIKQDLKETSGDSSYDWNRVVLTEMGNAIGIASVDRIVSENKDKNLNEIYVARIPVNDSKTCKYCRKFYNDPKSNSYKIYRLTTLLGNGSNYGKKADQWLPVIGSTHPNSRTSQVIEIPPGFKIEAGGRLTYIGLEKWKDYITQNLNS